MFMYRYALKNKDELGLNEMEVFETRTSIHGNLLMGSIPLLSILLSFIIPHPVIAGIVGGMTYLLYWPAMVVFSRAVTKRRKLLLEKTSSIGFMTPSDLTD
jgi:hypothetical protein